MQDILSFSGEHRWLSNFHNCTVLLDGVSYPTVEHAYQAAKAPPGEREKFRFGGPGLAKRYGRLVRPLPADWEFRKMDVMLGLLRQKFRVPAFRQKLLATDDAHIEEGNYWNDTFWGVCRGRGENHLGRLIMQVRVELRADQG